MKQVYTDNSIIAKLWATQAQDHARNPRRNFYFEDNTIYSYGVHFPIAILKEKFGRQFVIYNSRTFSVTTNRHQREVGWAIQRFLSMLPRLNFPLYGHEVDYDSWVVEQKAFINQYIRDLINPRKIYTPIKADFDAIIDRLNKAEFYLFNQTNPYHLDKFIRPVELAYLLTKTQERKTYRESKQRIKKAFGCSDYIASKIVRQAHLKAA